MEPAVARIYKTSTWRVQNYEIRFLRRKPVNFDVDVYVAGDVQGKIESAQNVKSQDVQTYLAKFEARKDKFVIKAHNGGTFTCTYAEFVPRSRDLQAFLSKHEYVALLQITHLPSKQSKAPATHSEEFHLSVEDMQKQQIPETITTTLKIPSEASPLLGLYASALTLTHMTVTDRETIAKSVGSMRDFASFRIFNAIIRYGSLIFAGNAGVIIGSSGFTWPGIMLLLVASVLAHTYGALRSAESHEWMAATENRFVANNNENSDRDVASYIYANIEKQAKAISASLQKRMGLKFFSNGLGFVGRDALPYRTRTTPLWMGHDIACRPTIRHSSDKCTLNLRNKLNTLTEENFSRFVNEVKDAITPRVLADERFCASRLAKYVVAHLMLRAIVFDGKKYLEPLFKAKVAKFLAEDLEQGAPGCLPGMQWACWGMFAVVTTEADLLHKSTVRQKYDDAVAVQQSVLTRDEIVCDDINPSECYVVPSMLLRVIEAENLIIFTRLPKSSTLMIEPKERTARKEPGI